MKLTDRQQAFVDEYLLDLNARQAAIRAGYTTTKSSNTGYNLLRLPKITAEIARRSAHRSEKTQISQERVLLEIARLAFNDPRRAFDDKGVLLPIKDWPAEVAAAISSIKVVEVKDSQGEVTGELKEIKFWDKGKQLELAARHLGLFLDKLEISTPVSQMILAARQRLKADDFEQ
jgi:phage terminase small subunit